MPNKLLDVSKDLKVVNKASFELATTLRDVGTGSSDVLKGIGKLSTALKSTDDAAGKFGKSLGALGTIGKGAAVGLFAVADAGAKIGALAAIGDAAYSSFKKLSGITRALDFEKAILGTDKLSANFEYLEKASGSAIGSIKVGLSAAFNTDAFKKFSGDAVAAYAPVEQAAYRLSTVTVGAGERSIDALGKNIKSMRELQKATNDSLSSVELLNAQYDIASAGFTSKRDNANVGKASVNLSQAGFGDLAGSTNATVRVLRALGDDSSKADLRVSQLFETTRVGLLTLDQLTPIIGNLSVQSKQLGVDFAEVTASVAGLTTQGASAGEAGTRLEALFAEIVNAAPAANKILSEFRDEAGKPIQLNASNLKSKGLQGIIKDIKTATGGDVAKISQLFSTKEATEAVQLLISLGDKAFKEYTDRIKNVDTADLGKEAEGRSKTITGAFVQAQNTSQRQVEEFGQGFGPSVVEDVLSANQAFKGFATGAATSIGSVAGTVSALSEKIKGIGGFLATAFTSVAPFALFAVLTTKVKQLGAALKKEAKEGQTIWDVIKSKAIDSFADIYRRWLTTMGLIKAKAKETGKDIQEALSQSGGDSEQLSIFDIPKDTASSKKASVSTEVSYPNDKDKGGKSNRKTLSDSVGRKSIDIDVPTNKLKGLDGFKQSLSNIKATSSSVFNGVKSASSVGFGALGKAAGFAAPLIKSTAGYLGAMGAAAGAGALAIAVASGWVSTFGSFIDKRTNPALQEMATNLKELKGVEGLADVLKEFDANTTAIEGSNYALNVFNEMGARTKGIWNQLTGASAKFTEQTLPELERVNALLDAQITKNAELASSGKIGTNTVEGKRAEEKIAKGITLGVDDETALKNEVEDKKKIFDARISQQEILLKQQRESGKFDEDSLAAEEQKLKVLKDQAVAGKATLQKGLDAKLVEQQIKRFKDIDTTIPISLQIQEQSTASIKTQIGEIRDVLDKSTGDIFADPSKYASDFADIGKNLGSVIDSISVEVDLDVTNAQDLRKQLIDQVGQDNFDKVLASNPQLRQKFSDVNKSITSGANAQTKLTETAQTSSFDAAQGLGSESGAVAAAKFAAQTASINSQVKTLNEELQRPETSMNRQRELIAEIEQLEASRMKLDVDAKISKELGSRKQQLSLDQEILNAKKATLNLFSQESKFGALAITSAQAKLQAAQQELALKKETIAIATKEELIKKQGIVDGLKKREDRAKDQASIGIDKSKIGDIASSKASFASKTDSETAAKIEAVRSDAARRIEEARKAGLEYSDTDKRKIEGGKNGDASQLASTLNEINSTKQLDTAKKVSDIKRESEAEIARLQENSSASKAKRNSLLDKLDSKATAGNNEVKTSGTDSTVTNNNSSDSGNEDKGSTAQDDLNFTKAISAVRERLGSLAERISLNEAKIELEFAGREKLIKRGELLGDSLQNLASKSAIFADSFAGSVLNSAAINSQNKGERLQKDADIEIAKIAQKVKDLSQNASDAREAAEIAKKAGADSKTTDKLDKQAQDAQRLADTAQSEQYSDTEFIRQKTALDKLTASVERNEANINKEFTGRERLVAQASLLSEGLSRLAGNALVAGTSIASSFALASTKAKVAGRETDTRADKQIALVNERLRTFTELAAQGGAAGAEAQGQLEKVKSEADAEIASINTSRALNKVADSLDLANAEIEKEFSSRQRIVDINEGLASSMSSLSGSISSLFKNSSIGSSLSRLNAEISQGSNKSKIEYDKQQSILERRSSELNKSLTTAKKSGASPKAIAALQEAVDQDAAQKPVEEAYLKQKYVLDTMTTTFSTMAAKVDDVTDRLSKQADILKQTIELEDRKRAASLENNKSGTGLQSALVGFLAKNNPVSGQLSQRLEIQQARDDAKGQQAQNVSDAKKELIDAAVQKSQLELEQQSYQNALSQTALLSDLLSISKGEQATASSGIDVQSQLAKLPSLFEEGRAQAARRGALLDDRTSFISQELEGKQANVKRNLLASELNTLGSNLNPANIDLLTRTLGESENEIKQFKRRDFKVGSLQDKDFQAQLDSIGNIQIPKPSRSNLEIDNRVRLQPPVANSNQSSGNRAVSIQAPITITIDASGTNGNNSQLEQRVMQNTSRQVNAAMSKLGKDIQAYSKNF